MVSLWCDIARIGGCCKVEEEVGKEDCNRSLNPETSTHKCEGGWYEHDFGDKQ